MRWGNSPSVFETNPASHQFLNDGYLRTEVALAFLKNFHFFIYILETGEGKKKREKHRCVRETSVSERNIYHLHLAHPQLGTWPTVHACGPTGN